MKLRRWAIITLGLILTIALVILVWNKEPTIYPYLLVAAALAGLLAFAIIGYCKGSVDKFSTVFLIFIVFLFLRNVRFIATHFEALTPVGVTWEYAAINAFSQMDKIFVIPPSPFSDVLTWYSSWPLMHTFSLIFADVLGIKLSLLPVILPTIFSLIGFLFVYLITDRLTADLKLNKVVVPLAVLFYAILPEGINFSFSRQFAAVPFVLVVFYLLHKYISHRDPRILALIILNAAAIVLTHHYTSFIFTVYLLLFAGLTFVLVLASRRAKPRWIGWVSNFRKEAAIIGIVGLLLASGIFVWWNQVATAIQPLASGVTTGTVQTVMPGGPGIELYIREGHYAESLTPPWVNLLWVRDFLIYTPVFFGFGWLIRKRFKVRGSEMSAAFYFLILSLICLGVLLIFDLFVSHAAPYRIVILSLPFITFCSALAYVKLLSKARWLRWLTLAVLVFVIVNGFLGLWGHRHAPIYLYSSAVNLHEFEETIAVSNRHYELQQFISENALDQEAAAIFSDNNYLLYLMLPSEEYKKIGSDWRELGTELHNGIARGDDLLVIDFGAKSYYTFYWTITGEEAEELRSQYRAQLEPNLNNIYTNEFQIWLSPAKER